MFMLCWFHITGWMSCWVSIWEICFIEKLIATVYFLHSGSINTDRNNLKKSQNTDKLESYQYQTLSVFLLLCNLSLFSISMVSEVGWEVRLCAFCCFSALWIQVESNFSSSPYTTACQPRPWNPNTLSSLKHKLHRDPLQPLHSI